MIADFYTKCHTHDSNPHVLIDKQASGRKVISDMKKSKHLVSLASSLAMSLCMVTYPLASTPVFAQDSQASSQAAETNTSITFVQDAEKHHFTLNNVTKTITSTFSVTTKPTSDLIYTLKCTNLNGEDFTISANPSIKITTSSSITIPESSLNSSTTEAAEITKTVTVTIPHDQVPADSQLTLTFHTTGLDFSNTQLRLEASVSENDTDPALVSVTETTNTTNFDQAFQFTQNWDQENSIWALDILPPIEYIKQNNATVRSEEESLLVDEKDSQQSTTEENTEQSAQATTEAFKNEFEEVENEAGETVNPLEGLADDENMTIISLDATPANAFEEMTSMNLASKTVNLQNANLSQIDLSSIEGQPTIEDFEKIANDQNLFTDGVMIVKSQNGYQIFVRDSAIQDFSPNDTIHMTFKIKRDAGEVNILTSATNMNAHTSETYTLETAQAAYTPGNPNDVTFKASHDYSSDAQTWTVKITLSDRPSQFILSFNQREGTALLKPTSFTIDGVAISPDVKTTMSGSTLKTATVTFNESQLNMIRNDSLVQLVFPVDGSKAQSEKIQMDVDTGNQKKSLSARFNVKAGTPHTSTETKMWSMIALMAGAVVVLIGIFFAKKKIAKK